MNKAIQNDGRAESLGTVNGNGMMEEMLPSVSETMVMEG